MALEGWQTDIFKNLGNKKPFVRFEGESRVLKKTGPNEACDAMGEVFNIPPEENVILVSTFC